MRAEIGEGLRRLWRHEVLRTLGLCLMNLTLMGALSILVLYAVGLDPRWFGLLLSTIAAAACSARRSPAG